MAALIDVQNEIATLGTLITAEIGRLQAQIATLQSQGAASAADLDGVVAAVKAVEATIPTS